MNAKTTQQIQAAQVVLPCAELDPTLEFFTERLGFRVAAIYPTKPKTIKTISRLNALALTKTRAARSFTSPFQGHDLYTSLNR